MQTSPRLAHVASIALASAALAASSSSSASIVWDHVYEDALARAAREKKPLFIAVNMDGEPANDRAAEKLYHDPGVVTVSAQTVNVVASRFDHAPDGKPCERFPGLTCREHRSVDGSVRETVLKPDANGFVVAPQHVFLAPDGKVILSVPYEVAAPELEWCFLTALNKVDPEHARAVPPTARPPRRLSLGGVFDAGSIPGANLAPPTHAQVLELLKELKAGYFGEGREEKLLRLMTSSEPEAMKYVAAELSVDLFGARGLRSGDPTDPKRGDRQQRLMHAIGVLSPPEYWEVVAKYLDHNELRLRQEAAVALEQLAAPDAVRDITSALAKEKEPKMRADLARALGSAGADDEKAIKALIKLAAGDKDAHVRVNAILALGWASPNADADRELSTRSESANVDERCAAALAMAISRNELWIDVLAKKSAADAEAKQVLDIALGVLRGGPLSALRDSVKKLAGDDIERERLFGRGP